jgi:uncharacterized protein (TIGR01244 family)
VIRKLATVALFACLIALACSSAEAPPPTTPEAALSAAPPLETARAQISSPATAPSAAPPVETGPAAAAPADLVPPVVTPPEVVSPLAPPPDAVPPVVTPPAIALPETAPVGVVNYSKVDATIACAGVTPLDALPHLKRSGFASVINLRRAEEEGADVEASRERSSELGLRYVHIPLVTDAPDPARVEEFLAAVTDPLNQPAFIHCVSANRVGALWYVKRVVLDGWSEEKAMEEATSIGLRTPGLKEFVVEYARNRGL